MNDYERRFPLYGIDAKKELASQEITSKLSEAALELEIETLHFGPKTDLIRKGGIKTVRDILLLPDGFLLQLQGMGRSTIARISSSLLSLAESQLDDGSTDWVSFCRKLELNLLPADPITGGTSEAISLLPRAIEEMLRFETNPIVHAILEHRIIKPPAERLTLEDIAGTLPKQVTRERVRQIESKFLGKLAGGLIHNDYSQSSYHFRPEFSQPWRLAANYFGDLEADITIEELILGLEQCWGIPRNGFLDQLPLIVAIVTGGLATSRDYNDLKLHTFTAFLNKQSAALDLPLKRLQMRKVASALEKDGLVTVADVLREENHTSETHPRGSHLTMAHKQIQHLAESVNENGVINWRYYADLAHVPFLPEESVVDPFGFLKSIRPVSIRVIECRKLSAIATTVFVKRICVPASERPTAEKLAKDLDTHGPVIKRVETHILCFLSDTFLGGDLACARAQLDPEFLAKWSFLDECFEQAGENVDQLIGQIARIWDVPEAEILKELPVIVAILTGYAGYRLQTGPVD